MIAALGYALSSYCTTPVADVNPLGFLCNVFHSRLFCVPQGPHCHSLSFSSSYNEASLLLVSTARVLQLISAHVVFDFLWLPALASQYWIS